MIPSLILLCKKIYFNFKILFKKKYFIDIINYSNYNTNIHKTQNQIDKFRKKFNDNNNNNNNNNRFMLIFNKEKRKRVKYFFQ